MFAIYRYALVLEFLAPLICWACLSRIVRSERVRKWFALGVGLLMISCTKPGDWGRRPWTDEYWEVKFPVDLKGALVVVAGTWPVGYLAAFLPNDTPMIRISEEPDPTRNPDSPGPPQTRTRLDDRVDETLRAHRGPIFVIARTPSRVAFAIASHRLTLLPGKCRRFQPNVEPFPLNLCEVGAAWRSDSSSR
jgi:hypothetical protein